MQIKMREFRHCEKRSDEAIQFFSAAVDCFASLAMTVELDQSA
jgi:hypothetical protein